MIYALAFGMLAVYFSGSDTAACPLKAAERTIFFESVPTDIDAPVIAQVTVTSLLAGPADSSFTRLNDDRYSFIGMVRVDHIFKGSLDSKVIKLVGPFSSCDHPFSAGDTGIVAGSLQRDGETLEFLAVVETWEQRMRRRNSPAAQ
jgi:hypothetical protein